MRFISSIWSLVGADRRAARFGAPGGRALPAAASLLIVILAAASVRAQVSSNAVPPRKATGVFEIPVDNTSTTTDDQDGKPRTPAQWLGLSPRQEQDVMSGIEQKLRSLNELTSRGLDNPVVRARFEKFLSAPAADSNQVARYVAVLTTVQDALQRREDRAAVRLLYGLSSYEWDAGIGRALAARVETVWDMRLTQGQLNDKIRTLRREIDQEIMNTHVLMKEDSISGSKQDTSKVPSQSSGTTSSQTSSNGPYTTAANISSSIFPDSGGLTLPGQKIRAMEEYVKRLEAGARVKSSEIKSDAIEIKNRSDFRDYITTLFATQRHQYVIIAADFYRLLFGDGDYPPSMANQVNASKETLRDVEQSVAVFNYKMENNELSGALEHLQLAFVASEFHPALLALSRESKRRVRGFGVNMVKLQNMLEARDFGEVEPLLKQMQEQAADFDGTKVRSIVDAVKLESRLRLGGAKLAAQGGDLKTAMNEFRAAAQAWPGNPDLDLAQLGFFNSQDVKNQMQQEFDRLFEGKNYRAIFEKQLMLAAALVGDVVRSEHMKAAMEKVKAAEMAIEKANLFRRNNNVFAAWEAVEQAARDWSEDSTLNKLRADLSAESAEFVQQIKKGEEAERAGNIGYSLTCYLNAQRLYPSSELARTAVERLSAQILNKGS